MQVIVMIDDNNGIMFNNRRQSQDCILREYLLKTVNNNKLYMTEYSAKQFEDKTKIIITDDFSLVDENDYVLIEDNDITPYIAKITSIIICKWNRTYPSDTHFTISLDDWKKIFEEDIKGYSHDKITIEKWVR